jgi:hypothetical protein
MHNENKNILLRPYGATRPPHIAGVAGGHGEKCMADKACAKDMSTQDEACKRGCSSRESQKSEAPELPYCTPHVKDIRTEGGSETCQQLPPKRPLPSRLHGATRWRHHGKVGGVNA